MPEPIRWGILSTANIATKVGSAIQSAANANLLAIASRCENKAREWAEGKGVPKYYGSYDSLLNDQEIDAVYIPLPPSMHAEWVIRSAEHGKHILCEKPILIGRVRYLLENIEIYKPYYFLPLFVK